MTYRSLKQIVPTNKPNKAPPVPPPLRVNMSPAIRKRQLDKLSSTKALVEQLTDKQVSAQLNLDIAQTRLGKLNERLAFATAEYVHLLEQEIIAKQII